MGTVVIKLIECECVISVKSFEVKKQQIKRAKTLIKAFIDLSKSGCQTTVTKVIIQFLPHIYTFLCNS